MHPFTITRALNTATIVPAKQFAPEDALYKRAYLIGTDSFCLDNIKIYFE